MVTLIISFYKNIPALDLIFKSLRFQTQKDFEVIIAEDASDDETRNFLEVQRTSCDFHIGHVWHDDLGFRKTKINNDAIRAARGSKLVFIDGDCIPHKRFIETYHHCIDEGKYFYGRRVMLGPEITQKLYSTRNLSLLSYANILFSDSKETREALYLPFRGLKSGANREIWGCNWGILKHYILGVNGFDEDYTKPCFGEDLDIGWRLRAKYGLRLSSLKNRAIQYHLFHEMNYDAKIIAEGQKVFLEKKQSGLAECKNGILKQISLI